MKKLITAASLIAFAAVAGSAAGRDRSRPGTPGTANCKGQTVAFVAQAAKNGYLDDAYRGIGGVGRATGLSNQQIHAIIDAYCAGTLVPPTAR